MTKDDIIRMAREAGFMDSSHPFNPLSAHIDQIERFAALVAAAEREACADIANQHASIEGIAQSIAAAIRARGEK